MYRLTGGFMSLTNIINHNMFFTKLYNTCDQYRKSASYDYEPIDVDVMDNIRYIYTIFLSQYVKYDPDILIISNKEVSIMYEDRSLNLKLIINIFSNRLEIYVIKNNVKNVIKRPINIYYIEKLSYYIRHFLFEDNIR